MQGAVRKLVLVMLGIAMAGCAAKYNFAPVAEVSGYEAVPMSGVYRVVAGDTLYSIAWRYGMDYVELARINHIDAPYGIHAGQTLYLNAEHEVAATLPVAKSESVSEPVVSKPPHELKQSPAPQAKKPSINKEPDFRATAWQWPAHGKVLALYSRRNKGIDIGAHVGEPIYAALPGKVVYAGSGLRGYGNLIILKHNSQMLSAYAYSKRLSVREGQWVKKGQKIASMGVGPNGKPMLHFEIRRSGLPVNPLNLLGK